MCRWAAYAGPAHAAHWGKVEESPGVHWTERGLEHFAMMN